MGEARSTLIVLVVLTVVVCADLGLFLRWISQSGSTDLLGFGLATLNILGLVLLGRAISITAQLLRVRRRPASPRTHAEIDAPGH
ncbi:MAG TPA: hypothetical protein VD837_03305 [Terriglobales bacterium]|nr:hypothetical protein [Terriglobales bacterium]